MNLAWIFHSRTFWVCRSWCNTHRTTCSLQTVTEGIGQKYKFNYLVKCIKNEFLKSVNFGAELRTKPVLVVTSHQQHSEDGAEVSPWNAGELSHHGAAVCPRTFYGILSSWKLHDLYLRAFPKCWLKCSLVSNLNCETKQQYHVLCCSTNINVDEVVTVNHYGWEGTTWSLIIVNIQQKVNMTCRWGGAQLSHFTP